MDAKSQVDDTGEYGFDVFALGPAVGEFFPDALLRLDYRSAVDGEKDWALTWPPESPAGDNADWVVVIHGHGSEGDQLFVRKDIHDTWIPAMRDRKLGILTVNLRGNGWMSPAAATDMHSLLEFIRRRFRAGRFIFASGSMGASSNVIYAALHPEDVHGLVALGLATDISSYYDWCRQNGGELMTQIADAIAEAYGVSPQEDPQLFAKHSALGNAARLSMPLYISHGAADSVIPVSQARSLVAAVGKADSTAYVEIPGGDHDAPLTLMADGLEWVMRFMK